jgi:hypothetical protein
MTRTEEALLAFVGTGEVNLRRLKAADFRHNEKMQNLIAEGMVEVNGEALNG